MPNESSILRASHRARRRPFVLAGAAIALSVWCLAAWRAATWSVTVDEAVTWHWFVAGGPRALLRFEANNHVLHTALVAISTKLLGTSQISLRLPALAGGALFLFFAFRVVRRMFGDGPALPIVLLPLVLNPAVVQYLHAARGYGLALGFLFAALYVLLGILEGAPTGRRLVALSLLVSLSALSNLAFAVPGAAAVAMAAVPALARRGALGTARSLVLPGGALFLVVAGPVLLSARPHHFFLGYDRLGDTFRDLVNGAFFYGQTAVDALYHRPGSPAAFLAAGPPAPARLASFLSLVFLPGLILLLGLALLRLAVKARSATLRPDERRLAAPAGVLVLGVALLAAAHAALGVPYPVERTALYAVPLAILALAQATLIAGGQLGRSRSVLVPAAVVAILVAAHFATELRHPFFRTWGYNRSDRQAFSFLAERAEEEDDATFGATWNHVAGLNFYRAVRGAGTLPRFRAEEEPDASAYDYFLVDAADRDALGVTDRPVLWRVNDGPTLVLGRRAKKGAREPPSAVDGADPAR